MQVKGMISLAAGSMLQLSHILQLVDPNAQMFPFESCSFTIKGGKQIHLTKKQLESALQYSPSVRRVLYYLIRLEWSC